MCLTMELTDRPTQANLYLRVDHKDRNQNKWADQLANQNPTGFDPQKRWHPRATMKIFNLTYKLMKKYRLDQTRATKSNNYKREKKDDQARDTYHTPRPNNTNTHTAKRTMHYIPNWVHQSKRQRTTTTTTTTTAPALRIPEHTSSRRP